MEAMAYSLTSLLAPALGSAMVGLAGWALSALARAAGERVKSERSKRAVRVVGEVVSSVVSELEAEVVRGLKERSGHLGPDDAKKVKQEAVKRVQDQLPRQAMKSIREVSSAPEEFIRGKVEDAVLRLNR